MYRGLFNHSITTIGRLGYFQHFSSSMYSLLINVEYVPGTMLDAADAKMSRALRE